MDSTKALFAFSRIEKITKWPRDEGLTPELWLCARVLEYLEDEEDARIAEEALDEHYRTGAKTISLAEVVKKLGLDN